MALIAGAGNPTGGSNPSGISSGLTYVGDFVYLNSGIIDCDNAETTLGDFITSNQVIDAIIQFYYAEFSSDDFQYLVKLNGQTIVQYHVSDSHGTGASEPDNQIYLILPPYSRVELLAKNVSTGTSREQCVTMRGRLYA